MQKTIKLNDAAKLLQVHPRTVLRYISDEENPYWAANYNPSLMVASVGYSFGCRLAPFQTFVIGSDSPDRQVALDDIENNPGSGNFRVPTSWNAVQIAASGSMPRNPMWFNGDCSLTGFPGA